MATPSASSSRADRLIAAASEAAEVRTAQRSPHVRALKLEQQRSLYNTLIWTAVVAGLAFTASNVQAFAARGATFGSLSWWFAWLLDPTVAIPLVAVLVIDQTLSSNGGRIPRSGQVVKVGALAMTYSMNTWAAWSALDARLVLLHSVPVIGVFIVVSAATGLRNALTATIEAVSAEPDPLVQDSPVPIPKPIPGPDPSIPDRMPAPVPAPAPQPQPQPTPAPAGWNGLEAYRDAGVAAALKLGDALSRNTLLAEFRNHTPPIQIGTERAARLVKLLKTDPRARPLHAVGSN